MFLACLCASLTLASAAVPTGSSVPHKCCADHQFEATLGEFGGTILPTGEPHLLNGFNRLSYDFYTKTMHLESHMADDNGTMSVLTNVTLDYKRGKEYVTTSAGCTVFDITETMREPCVPPSAVFKGTNTFGFGTQTLIVHDWEYKLPGTDNVVRLAVTDDGCIPFVETSYGIMNNAPTNVVYFVTNFHPGIRDRSVLQLPKDCQPGGMASGFVGRAVRAMKNLYSR